MKIYLASPLFTDFEKTAVITTAYLLRKEGHKVYVPMENKIEDAWLMPNHIWARKVFEEDIKHIQECDKVVCLYYGLYSDSGTAWECGYAYGINKPVEIIDYAGQELSLMVINSSTNSLSFTEKIQS